MIKLTDYDILVNDTFYRSWHLFEYIEKHPNMSDLDRDAIKATIMDALVYANLIDEEKDALDLDNMCIVRNDDDKYYHYEKTPYVSGIPMELKEKLRYKCVRHSGCIPVSLVFAKPCGGSSFCIYDMNEIFSVIFDKFSFVSVSYDSPTRGGIRVSKRPFLQINLNDEEYYVDALTKRIFRVDEFIRRYNGIVEESICNLDFNEDMKKLYEYRSTPRCDFAFFLISNGSFYKEITNSAMAESCYEFEKTKELYPEEWEKIPEIKAHMDLVKDSFPKDLFRDLFI